MKMRLLPLLLLTACAANPATGGYNFTLTNKHEQTAIGESSANATLKAEGIYRPTSAATLYVNNLCNRLYAVTEAAQEAVQCNLIDDADFNAFATPGYLFVNRGLLPFISSEAELAAVLGHESGHLTARHVAKSVTQAKIATAIVGGAIAAAASNGAGYGTAQTVADGSRQLAQIGMGTFSRSHETEADSLGRRYMEKAGYDPHEGLTMVRAMNMYDVYQQQQAQAFGAENQSLLDRLKSSHPATPERVAAALAATGEPTPVPPELDTGRQRYMQAIEGLAWGPARRYGIARKQELVLTKQRVVIPLPAGATTAYQSSRDHDLLGTWLIAHPQSGAYVRITSVPMTSGRNPATLVQAMLPFLHTPVLRINIGDPSATIATDTADLETTTAADTDTADALADAQLDADNAGGTSQVIGYTATYHYLNSPKHFRTTAFGAATRKNEMLLLTTVYPNEATFQREDANLMAILKNVRFLTRTQALKVQQLQLHTFTAATGQTVAQQGVHLPVGALQEPLFRALNNLPEGTELIPGQLYKTIRDPNP